MNFFNNISEFIPLLSQLKNNKETIVFTNGVFDILHRGHLEYLQEAKDQGSILIVGLNSDSSVKKIKGESRPINKESDRAFLLSGLKPVDQVIIFQEETPYELIKIIEPDVLVKGGDWKLENIAGSDIVLNKGGKVLSVKFVNDYSTTKILEKAKKTGD